MCCVLVGGTLLDVDLFIEQLTLRQQVKLFLAHSVPALRFHLNIDYSRKNEKESSSSQQFPPPPPPPEHALSPPLLMISVLLKF